MPKLPLMAGRSDQYQTPPEAVDILYPYLNKEAVIWECAWGKGNLVSRLRELGFNVIASNVGEDFLTIERVCDCVVTNPPYSLKDKFLARCYELGKPFALLMPLTALEGKFRQSLYRKYGISLLIPNKRFNFDTPSGSGSGSWFATAWYTWKLFLPEQLTFVDLSKVER